MSTEYELAPNWSACEASSLITIGVDTPAGESLWTPRMDEHQLRTAIIKRVEVLSHVSDDPDAALARFNVRYGDTV